MRIAIIPARGGSKGLPRKNLRRLLGKPLILWTVEAALDSASVDRVVLSTDDEEIAACVSGTSDVEVRERPKHLATDEAGTVDVVLDVVDHYALADDDLIVLLQPTSPLRNAVDIDDAMAEYEKGGCDSVVSVRNGDRKAFWTFYLEDGMLRPLFNFPRTHRQTLPPTYLPNGAIYIIGAGDLREQGSFITGRCRPYVMPEGRSVDIDAAKDLVEAQRSLRPLGGVFIGAREIGPGRPVYIIAEAGVNHNGDLDMALKLASEAAAAGADAVKFQTFRTEKVISKSAEKAAYQAGTEGDSQFEMVKRLELPLENFRELRDHCQGLGIEFLSTPFDSDSLDYLVDLGMRAIKVSSCDLNNLPFLETVASKGLPVLLSTGMSTQEEVDRAVDLISAKCPLVIMQCTTNYPSSFSTLNLRVIQTYDERYGIPVGLSDHSPGYVAAVAAVALGANLVEKHFTLDHDLLGPDHRASLDPLELREMIAAVRNTEKVLGDGIKRPCDEEGEIAEVARRSLVTSAPLRRGMVVTSGMLEVKRPGTGIPPDRLDDVIGRKIRRDMGADEVLRWEDLE